VRKGVGASHKGKKTLQKSNRIDKSPPVLNKHPITKKKKTRTSVKKRPRKRKFGGRVRGKGGNFVGGP